MPCTDFDCLINHVPGVTIAMGLDPSAWQFDELTSTTANVGLGATFAAFIVLPAMGFPVTVAALLISIEPLIDMARTALNVNGAMTARIGIAAMEVCRPLPFDAAPKPTLRELAWSAARFGSKTSKA